jgi:uroporphyrin-III C-methyltransferase
VTVSLVGAGPGDPGLITVKGLELVRRCDVLVYDRLVAPELVDEAPPDALRIARDPLEQEEINRLLVAYAHAGLDVVRLKGGDPILFGRGGEETLALAAAGVPFEIVSGVSALSAVPIAAGIPVTQRGIASEVTVATGHSAGGLDFARLAHVEGTLVLFMALGRLAEIAAGLIDHGRAPDTPAAVISHGTLPSQQAVYAPLAEIADAAGDVEAPALVVIGDVVSLAEQLQAAPGRKPAAASVSAAGALQCGEAAGRILAAA